MMLEAVAAVLVKQALDLLLVALLLMVEMV
jgi:hypothetical protein